jgi:chromate reductase
MRVLGGCGSSRARSGNRALRETAASVAPSGLAVELFEGLRELPPFDPDVAVGSQGIRFTMPLA